MVSGILILAGCAPPPAPAPTETADTAPPVVEHVFSFAILADPHVSGAGDHADRLERAVAWITDEAEARDLALVFVLGDIGWSEEGLALSRQLLDALPMPYLPVLGDNEVHFESEALFDTTFADHYEALAGQLDGFSRGPVEVQNPEWATTSWFQNFSFTYGGVWFLSLDWNSRDPDPLWGEYGELHDFEGGSWPWFEAELAALDPGEAEDVLLFSHHPMHAGVFDSDEMDRIVGATVPVAGRVAAAFAGHIHGTYEQPVSDGGYDVYVTDAVWDDEITVRIVDVGFDGARTTYTQSLEVVPEAR